MKEFIKKEPADILYYSIWLGLLTGLVEGTGLFLLQEFELLKGKIMFLGSSYEVIWIAAFVDLCLFLFFGVILVTLSRVIKPALLKRIALFFLLFLLFFSWLDLIFSGRISIWATIILASGIAFQVSQWLYRKEILFTRLVRMTGHWFFVGTLLLMFVIQGSFWLKEKTALQNLPPAKETAPNVLVIVVDALRADHLSNYGYERNTDPNLTRLAQEGILFENAYAASSWTVPSHASLFTGRWPHEHGVDSNPLGDNVIRMDDTYPTIGEVLQKQGYRTAAFSGNFETLNKLSGLGRGFIHFEDYYQSFNNILISSVYGRLFEYYGLHGVFNMQYKIDRKLAGDINQSTLHWIDENSDHPFFVFINYFDVHAPYIPPQPFRSQFSKIKNPGGIINTDWGMDHIYVPMSPEQLQGEVDAYDGSIAYVDSQIESLLDGLKAQGELGNTLVIITSDHGELFGEHGLLEHHNSLYRPVIHVPLILWWPDHLPQGKRIDLPVSNVSLPATILDFIGAPEQAQFPVPSLVKIWTDPASIADWPNPIAEVTKASWLPPGHLPASGNMKSVVSSEWQYIEHDEFGVELYDLLQDPLETQNLALEDKNHTVIDQLKTYLEELIKRTDK